MLAADRSRSARAYGSLRGIGPTRAEEARGRRGFRAVREGFWCSLPRLAADRSRSAWRILGLRGIGPTRAEEAQVRRGFRAVREGFCCSPPRLAADRSRSARGIVVIAFNARFGPVSLPLRVGWVFGAADVRRLRGSWGCCWGRCLARRRFGRINCATWRLLIVPRSGPGDLTRVLLLLARALARVLARARVRRRCRRPIRRIGRRRGSG